MQLQSLKMKTEPPENAGGENSCVTALILHGYIPEVLMHVCVYIHICQKKQGKLKQAN